MKKIFILTIVLVAGVLGMKAQTSQLPDIDPVLENIIRSYSPWYSVEFNGKLKNDNLPIAPTIKIFMIKDSLIQISARVPIMGEIGRLDVTPSRMVLVNRMKKTYVEENTSGFLQKHPDLISDIQNMLLARVTLFGQGPLSYENAAMVEIEQVPEGGWVLVPLTSDWSDLSYGYVIAPNNRTVAFESLVKGMIELGIQYTYSNSSMKMEINATVQNKKFDCELDFSSVKWGGTAMSPLKLDGYQKLGIKDFMKSLR